MFIPKAYLLHQTYKKHRSDLTQRTENEKKLVAGHLVGLLREPKRHKQGVVSGFFSKEKFPLLSQEENNAELEKVMNPFRESGYQVTLDKSDEGFTLNLDWTDVKNH